MVVDQFRWQVMEQDIQTTSRDQYDRQFADHILSGIEKHREYTRTKEKLSALSTLSPGAKLQNEAELSEYELPGAPH